LGEGRHIQARRIDRSTMKELGKGMEYVPRMVLHLDGYLPQTTQSSASTVCVIDAFDR
jgi:hypothetical protein